MSETIRISRRGILQLGAMAPLSAHAGGVASARNPTPPPAGEAIPDADMQYPLGQSQIPPSDHRIQAFGLRRTS